jgi:hypothetical protein
VAARLKMARTYRANHVAALFVQCCNFLERIPAGSMGGCEEIRRGSLWFLLQVLRGGRHVCQVTRRGNPQSRYAVYSEPPQTHLVDCHEQGWLHKHDPNLCLRYKRSPLTGEDKAQADTLCWQAGKVVQAAFTRTYGATDGGCAYEVEIREATQRRVGGHFAERSTHRRRNGTRCCSLRPS